MGYPCRGKVWFYGGKKYPAAIYGTWNGWAVATTSLKHAIAMLSSTRDYKIEDLTPTSISVRSRSMGTCETLQVSGKRVFFDPGWSLYHECGAGEPPPLLAKWRRDLGPLDPLPVGDRP